MVDMEMGVQDVAHVAHPDAVPRELVLDHVLVELQPPHAEAFHDLVVAVAGVHHDRPGAAEDQEAVCWNPPRAAAISAKHEKARFQLDVAIVEDLDFERHYRSPSVLVEAVDPPCSVVENGVARSGRHGLAMRGDQLGIARPEFFDRKV